MGSWYVISRLLAHFKNSFVDVQFLDYESAEDAARVAGTEVYRTARNNLEGFLEVIDQINLGCELCDSF